MKSTGCENEINYNVMHCYARKSVTRKILLDSFAFIIDVLNIL